MRFAQRNHEQVPTLSPPNQMRGRRETTTGIAVIVLSPFHIFTHRDLLLHQQPCLTTSYRLLSEHLSLWKG